MKLFVNILLGIGAVAALAVLLLQGFVLPSLLLWQSLLLRIVAAFFTQWLFIRLFQKKWLRALPILLTSLAAVWGFFLYLTSPSWLGATFQSFLYDYASPALSCAAVWILGWLLPRLLPVFRDFFKELWKRRRRKRKKKKTH